MKILITGGGGFIGSHLAERLLNDPGAWRMDTFRVPPGSIVGRAIVVDGPEGHHAVDVVRVRTGDLTLRALRGIRAGDEFFLNYLATEARLAAPFECGCGARWCPGLIAGYRALTPWQKQAITHITAKHLR